MFFMLLSINWPNFIARLPLLLEILGKMYITTVCYPGCDVIKFEINLIFLIKPFGYMTKYEDKNLNILRRERAFEVKWKALFIIFNGLAVVKNCLRPESATLKIAVILNIYKKC